MLQPPAAPPDPRPRRTVQIIFKVTEDEKQKLIAGASSCWVEAVQVDEGYSLE